MRKTLLRDWGFSYVFYALYFLKEKFIFFYFCMRDLKEKKCNTPQDLNAFFTSHLTGIRCSILLCIYSTIVLIYIACCCTHMFSTVIDL